MAEAPPKTENTHVSFAYKGDVAAALVHLTEENRKVENALSDLARHEQSFVEARKEVLGKIVKTRRRQSWRLRKGTLWLRWLGFQRIWVELRIVLTNIMSFVLFIIGWLIMVATFLAGIALGAYLVITIIQALING